MALQNRVTPFGDIVAIRQRGMFTGNRGIIHDPATMTLLKRRWTSRAWLICTCDYKGVRRTVMGGRSWTELFFDPPRAAQIDAVLHAERLAGGRKRVHATLSPISPTAP